jgi:hypothetical protein
MAKRSLTASHAVYGMIFGINSIRPIQVAHTAAQIEQFRLPPIMSAKESSSNYHRFVEDHGSTVVHELEALQPADLERVLTDAIDSVLDIAAFNSEIEQEKKDATFLEVKRQAVFDYLAQAGFDDDGGEAA